MSKPTCKVANCCHMAAKIGLCQAHYSRWYRHGDVQEDVPLRPRRADPILVMDLDDGSRVCAECGVIKPLSGFHRDAKSPKGRRKVCKICRTRREKARYTADSKAIRENRQEFRAANRDRVRSQDKARYERNREARLDLAIEHSHLRRAKHFGVLFERGITPATVHKIDGDRCCYCGVQMMFDLVEPGLIHDNSATLEHLVPMSKGGAHAWENCALACWKCNRQKGSDSGGTWQVREGHRLSEVFLEGGLHGREAGA